MSQISNPSSLMSESPLTDFPTYYRKKIRPYLLDLERKREGFLATYKVHERNYLIVSAVVGLALSGTVIWFELLGSMKWIFAGSLLALPFLVMKYWLAPVMREKVAHNERHEAFYNRYKSKVIESMVKFFDTSLKLQYEEKVSKDIVRNSQLIQNLSHIAVEGDDYVNGQVYGLPVFFSELQLTEQSQKGGKDIFHGLFFVGTLQTPIQGAIFIIPKTVLPGYIWNGTEELEQTINTSPLKDHHRTHNIKAMQWQMSNLQPWNPGAVGHDVRPVPLEHKQAKANYAVFASHPNHAHHILSHELWDFLLLNQDKDNIVEGWSDKQSFIQAVSTGLYISIIANKVYVMQPQGGDLFEPDMEQSFLEESGLSNYHENLQKVFCMMYHIQQEAMSIAE